MGTLAAPGRSRSGTLVLLRHAQSLWNRENRFSGWADMELSEAGIAEAQRAGALLRQHGFVFDRAFVSLLRRATQTLDIVLAGLGQRELPVTVDWHLNERHYGALQGLNKAETAARYGAGQFHRWRRGYHDRPPALELDDPRHPRFEARYAGLAPGLLPVTESLADTERRVVPYWQQAIAPRVTAGEHVLVVAHGNTFRALIRHLDQLSVGAVEKLEVPTGQPLVYEFSREADRGLRPRRSRYLAPAAGPSPSIAR
jgi:2,3-bisphosphoglycerate-dependent phosphoglycerate mutase